MSACGNEWEVKFLMDFLKNSHQLESPARVKLTYHHRIVKYQHAFESVNWKTHKCGNFAFGMIPLSITLMSIIDGSNVKSQRISIAPNTSKRHERLERLQVDFGIQDSRFETLANYFQIIAPKVKWNAIQRRWKLPENSAAREQPRHVSMAHLTTPKNDGIANDYRRGRNCGIGPGFESVFPDQAIWLWLLCFALLVIFGEIFKFKFSIICTVLSRVLLGSSLLHGFCTPSRWSLHPEVMESWLLL